MPVTSVVAAALVLAGAVTAMPPLPLSTSGRWILDARGGRVRLTCANWSGAEEKDFVVGGLDHSHRDEIAGLFHSYGFNCVRLLWYVTVGVCVRPCLSAPVVSACACVGCCACGCVRFVPTVRVCPCLRALVHACVCFCVLVLVLVLALVPVCPCG
jgi:hypothetical protein